MSIAHHPSHHLSRSSVNRAPPFLNRVSIAHHLSRSSVHRAPPFIISRLRNLCVRTSEILLSNSLIDIPKTESLSGRALAPFVSQMGGVLPLDLFLPFRLVFWLCCGPEAWRRRRRRALRPQVEHSAPKKLQKDAKEDAKRTAANEVVKLDTPPKAAAKKNREPLRSENPAKGGNFGDLKIFEIKISEVNRQKGCGRSHRQWNFAGHTSQSTHPARPGRWRLRSQQLASGFN